jgi:hypothetical protein
MNTILFNIGDRVVVKGGPLRNFTGTVLYRMKHGDLWIVADQSLPNAWLCFPRDCPQEHWFHSRQHALKHLTTEKAIVDKRPKT